MLGYEADLKFLYDDPIAHFRQEAKRLTAFAKAERTISINIDLNEHFSSRERNGEQAGDSLDDDLVSIGHLPLSTVYHELELDQFVKNRHKNWGITANVTKASYGCWSLGGFSFPAQSLPRGRNGRS